MLENTRRDIRRINQPDIVSATQHDTDLCSTWDIAPPVPLSAKVAAPSLCVPVEQARDLARWPCPDEVVRCVAHEGAMLPCRQQSAVSPVGVRLDIHRQ